MVSVTYGKWVLTAMARALSDDYCHGCDNSEMALVLKLHDQHGSAQPVWEAPEMD